MQRILQRGLTMAAAAAVVAAACMAQARADQVVITYSPAGVFAPDFGIDPSTGICAGATACDYGLENFSNWSGNGTYTSTFNDAGAGTYNQPSGVSFTGDYAVGAGTTIGSGGEFIAQPQNLYGGVAGSNYPELYGPTAYQATNKGTDNPPSYTVDLSSTGVPGINYFGIWISALDPYNDLRIYSGNTLLAEFDSSVLLQALGNCATPAENPYCGNPTPQYQGGDNSELFSYVNVFDLTGYITSVQFFNGGYTGFESTNDAVAYVDPIHVDGTELPVPEPLSLSLLGVGVAGLAALRRRRSK